MLRKLCISFLTVFFVLCFVVISSVSNATDYTFRGDSGTQSFGVCPGQSSVTFSPNKTGSWWFKAYHTFLFAPPTCSTPNCNCVGVFTYWKDTSNPNDYWHYWPGGGAACYYFFGAPNGRTLLYSGKPSIAYKFELSNYDSWCVDVKINLEKR